MERCAILDCVHVQSRPNHRPVHCQRSRHSHQSWVRIRTDGRRGHGDQSPALDQCATSNRKPNKCHWIRVSLEHTVIINVLAKWWGYTLRLQTFKWTKLIFAVFCCYGSVLNFVFCSLTWAWTVTDIAKLNNYEYTRFCVFPSSRKNCKK